jgi:hypothetical protein
MVLDLMRGIDLLMDRPEIDARRIILSGTVAGGGRSSGRRTGALDPRVAAAIPRRSWFNIPNGQEIHTTLG